MSVIVLGMEMPNSCLQCILFAGNGCKGSGKIFPDWLNVASRPTGCPLRPLPEKHGRLGDLDALRDVQQADADFFAGSSDYGEKVRYDEALNAVANILNAPTIVESEGENE